MLLFYNKIAETIVKIKLIFGREKNS